MLAERDVNNAIFGPADRAEVKNEHVEVAIGLTNTFPVVGHRPLEPQDNPPTMVIAFWEPTTPCTA